MKDNKHDNSVTSHELIFVIYNKIKTIVLKNFVPPDKKTNTQCNNTCNPYQFVTAPHCL